MVESGGLTFGMPITSLPYLYSFPSLNFDPHLFNTMDSQLANFGI